VNTFPRDPLPARAPRPTSSRRLDAAGECALAADGTLGRLNGGGARGRFANLASFRGTSCRGRNSSLQNNGQLSDSSAMSPRTRPSGTCASGAGRALSDRSAPRCRGRGRGCLLRSSGASHRRVPNLLLLWRRRRHESARESLGPGTRILFLDECPSSDGDGDSTSCSARSTASSCP
jgi:hypothetical protein